MALTFQIIDKVSLNSAANTVTFSSIPNTYTDLMLYFSVRSSENNKFIDQGFRITFNGSTSGYSTRLLYGYAPNSPSAGGASNTGQTFSNFYYGTGSTALGNAYGNGYAYIPNYTGNNKKSISSDSGSTDDTNAGILAATYGYWDNTSAITSLSCICNGNNFVAYSTFTLYGIKKA